MADVDHTKVELPEFVDPGNYGEVSGDMAVPGTVGGSQAEDYNTLDEPLRVTIYRDLKAVGNKFYHVLYPKEKKTLLKEWDLWGPLILCTFLAVMVQGTDSDAPSSGSNQQQNDGGPEFAEVFLIVWAGAAVVTLNTKLLGGTISFFQSVCVLGYCLLPTCMSVVICRIILLASQSNILFTIRFIVTCGGFVWATFAAMVFLGDSQPSSRKALAVYPIFLFYFVISWLIISRSNT